MASVNHGAPVGAIGRRFPSECETILPSVRSQCRSGEKAPADSGSEAWGQDPLGLRVAWLRTRKAIKQIAVKRKQLGEDRKHTERWIPDLDDDAMERIRTKLHEMTENPRSGLGGSVRKQIAPKIAGSPMKDPPDKGGGISIAGSEEREIPGRKSPLTSPEKGGGIPISETGERDQPERILSAIPWLSPSQQEPVHVPGPEHEMIPKVLLNPLVQAASATVSAIKVSDSGTQLKVQATLATLNTLSTGVMYEGRVMNTMPPLAPPVVHQAASADGGLSSPIPSQMSESNQQAKIPLDDDPQYPPGFGPVA